MKKRIVVALGGNALGNTSLEQKAAVKVTSKAIVDLIEEGYEVVISHGNGPQVGMINLAISEYDHLKHGDSNLTPLSASVAMSQAYIGSDLQNAMREELLNRDISKPVSTIVTQVIVDKTDPAFSNPTKPIGSFMTREEGKKLEDKGFAVVEDSGRGYRRVVASPRPKEIVEIDTVKSLLAAGEIVITCGGGGIPVVKEGNSLNQVHAVIDKDFASSLLARELDAELLIILTAVEKVAINFNTPNVIWLDSLTTSQAEEYIKQGQFGKGSMLPKIQASIEFASSSKDRVALITLLDKAKDGIRGKTGTLIK